MLARGLPLLGKGRSPTNRRHEMNVTLTANTARGYHDTLSRLGEISYLIEHRHSLWVELPHLCAHGNLEDEVPSVSAMATGTLTMRATTGFEVMPEAIVDEGRELWIALEDNVTAVTAIAAVRTTLRHEGLTTK